MQKEIGRWNKERLKKGFKGESQEDIEYFENYLEQLDSFTESKVREDVRRKMKEEACKCLRMELGEDVAPEDLEIIGEFVQTKDEGIYQVTEEGLVKFEEEKLSDEERKKSLEVLSAFSKIYRNIEENCRPATALALRTEIDSIIDSDDTQIWEIDPHKVLELAKEKVLAKALGSKKEVESEIGIKEKSNQERLAKGFVTEELQRMFQWDKDLRGLIINVPRCPICLETNFGILTDENNRPILTIDKIEQPLTAWEHMALRHPESWAKLLSYYRKYGAEYPKPRYEYLYPYHYWLDKGKCREGFVYDPKQQICIPIKEFRKKFGFVPMEIIEEDEYEEELSTERNPTTQQVILQALAKEKPEEILKFVEKLSREKEKKKLSKFDEMICASFFGKLEELTASTQEQENLGRRLQEALRKADTSRGNLEKIARGLLESRNRAKSLKP